MVNQLAQYTLTKIGNDSAKAVKTPTVKDISIDEEDVLKFKRKVFQYHDSYSKPEDVDKEIINRRHALLSQPKPEEPETFGSKPISLPKKPNGQKG